VVSQVELQMDVEVPARMPYAEFVGINLGLLSKLLVLLDLGILLGMPQRRLVTPAEATQAQNAWS